MPRIHQQWLPDLTNVEPYALSPDSRKLPEAKGSNFGPAQPANHLAVIVIGAPSLMENRSGITGFMTRMIREGIPGWRRGIQGATVDAAQNRVWRCIR